MAHKSCYLALLGFAFLANHSGCGSSSASGVAPSSRPCYGPGCATGGASGAGGAANGVINPQDAGPTTTWSWLCGSETASGCVPDSDAGGCGDLINSPPAPKVTSDAGNESTEAGISNDSSTLTCRIRSSVAGSISIVRVCELAGSGGPGSSCRMPTDCGTGLTCVSEGQAGVCRPYCCADPEACPKDTYCTSRFTLLDLDLDTGTRTTGSEVPVCAPAENCSLSDACTDGQSCTCSGGKACMIVRRLGLTACVTPGSGTQGQFCPCAAGFVCSNTTFTCLKLCQLTSNVNSQAASPCGKGNTCQASNDVPPDWGVCNDLPLIID